jgi:AcrR family transcriptional regulator
MHDWQKEEETEAQERLKLAARKVFLEKGFAAATTRDIAQEADMNLALLNYYFRSKKRLFHIIMLESLQSLLHTVSTVLNDTETTVEQKLAAFVEVYINQLKADPDLPVFILSEVRANPSEFLDKLNYKDVILNSLFFKQLKEGVVKGDFSLELHPIHWFFNLIGMLVFPFAAAPIVKNLMGLNTDDYMALMDERKQLIPKWMGMITSLEN